MTRLVCDVCGSGYAVKWSAIECRDLCVECRTNLALTHPTAAEVADWNKRPDTPESGSDSA